MDAPPDVTFEVPAAAVGALAERLGLPCSPLSPIAFLVAHASSQPAPAEDDPRLGEALAAMLQPEAVTVVRSVDAAGAASWRTVCQSRAAIDGRVALAALDGGTLRVSLFASPVAAAVSLAPTLFTALAGVSSPPLPREWPVGAFIDAFHAVDRYRRGYAEAMLTGAPLGDLVVRARELVATLDAAAASDDLRWLLPAFLRLTPGVRAADVATGATQLGRLLSAGVFRDPEGTGDDPTVRYGAVGRALGQEFARGWWGAAGVEHSLLLADGVHAMHRGFVAATALANHWFTVRDDAAGAAVLEHRPLAYDAAQERLLALLTEADVVTGMASWTACPRCGRSVTLGAARCGVCGHPFTA